MALPFYNWSRTAASNATADSTVNWAENQAPSSVNDSARAMMASTAAFRDDISGAITTGGSATAYTVTSYQVFDTLAHMNGAMIAFTPHATSTNTVGVDVTLNVDGLGAKSIRGQPNVALPTGSLILGTPYVVTYNNSDGVFYLQGGAGSPYSIPLGGGLDFWGSTAPNSAFAFPAGQAISRTTYASLFTLISTTYGTGDGSTTFNLPDLRGRVAAAADNMGGSAANRLSTTSMSSATALGGNGGAETHTLVTGNLPPYTPAGSVAISNIKAGSTQLYGWTGSGSFTATVAGGNSAVQTSGMAVVDGGTASFTGTAQGGTSTPLVTIQPTIICNYIMRVI